MTYDMIVQCSIRSAAARWVDYDIMVDIMVNNMVIIMVIIMTDIIDV